MRNSNISKFIRHLVAIIVVISMMALSACSHKEKVSYKDFLGEENYESDAIAMVIDYIDGEEEPGVIYREVTDINGIIHQTEIPVCIFFYSGNATDRNGVFAGVEEISERLNGRVLIVAVDIMIHRELVDEYELIAVPDFVLFKNGTKASSFGASNYDYWTMTDVYNWLVLNKV